MQITNVNAKTRKTDFINTPTSLRPSLARFWAMLKHAVDQWLFNHLSPAGQWLHLSVFDSNIHPLTFVNPKMAITRPTSGNPIWRPIGGRFSKHWPFSLRQRCTAIRLAYEQPIQQRNFFQYVYDHWIRDAGHFVDQPFYSLLIDELEINTHCQLGYVINYLYQQHNDVVEIVVRSSWCFDCDADSRMFRFDALRAFCHCFRPNIDVGQLVPFL